MTSYFQAAAAAALSYLLALMSYLQPAATATMSYLQATGASTKSVIRCGRPHNPEKKLLILDLDETLVHRSKSITRNRSTDKTYDFSYTKRNNYPYYVRLRPYAQKFLGRVSELFDVVIFTASFKDNADRVLDFLDPQGKLFVGRYYHDSCTYLVDGSYVKDLSIFNVDLAKVILVDDRPTNFRWQRDNGIPVASWYFDPQDNELARLLPFLESLAPANDVRPIIAERFTCSKNDKRGGGKQEKCTEAPKEFVYKSNKEFVPRSGIIRMENRN
ncbi:hypothetical protein MKX03_009656 [Papaver bracteatum]|nr:hypothetical protein MKX03_009656 [Papaver bracteatum]